MSAGSVGAAGAASGSRRRYKPSRRSRRHCRGRNAASDCFSYHSPGSRFGIPVARSIPSEISASISSILAEPENDSHRAGGCPSDRKAGRTFFVFDRSSAAGIDACGIAKEKLSQICLVASAPISFFQSPTLTCTHLFRRSLWTPTSEKSFLIAIPSFWLIKSSNTSRENALLASSASPQMSRSSQATFRIDQLCPACSRFMPSHGAASYEKLLCAY